MRKVADLIVLVIFGAMFFLKAFDACAEDGSGSFVFGIQQSAAHSSTMGAITGNEALKEQGKDLYETSYL